MGGDGGVIASNRKFMRGAGTADLTADFNHHAKEKVKHNAQDAMTTCALTKTPLLHVISTTSSTDGTTKTNTNTHTHTIVADPYGRLYHKEAAVHALLKRKRCGDDSNTADTIGPQVRRMNDLYDVRFHFDNNNGNNKNIPSCPITGKALTGSISAILLVSTTKSDGGPNVVSESALKQLSMDGLQEEYGCIQRKVRLAPDPTLLESIKEQVQKEHDIDEEQRNAKKAAKKNKRKLRDDGGSDNKKNKKHNKKNDSSNKKEQKFSTKAAAKTILSSSSLGQQVQSRVDSTIQKNTIYSSIFVDKSLSSKISEKEKKDNLFAR
jgi:hypothetical protein